ncbi:MAG TPA: polysaccharide deacetylase family protein [Gammaproteobacteria bacterium]|nr:polysaccharide deacetylase family protein [Gammaproteobacteria bacterium]HET7588078.1 polysaccharide deacetylase family protein [Gammaproteobacteria bacterium]
MRWLRCNLHHLSLAWLIATGMAIALFGWPALALLVPAIALIWLVADGIARPASSVFYPTIAHGPRGSRRVALTFDDGPDPDVTPQVLDALAAAGAHATFFVIGRKLAAQPDIGRRIVAEGHALDNHSWRHSRLQNFYRPRRHREEIDRCHEAIAALGRGDRPILYRPPVGLKCGELARAAWQRDVTMVAWSLHSHDTRLPDPEAIAARVLARVRGGDIVLLHDGHDLPGERRAHCVEAVRLILEGLREKGLECVTVPELLASGHLIDRLEPVL